jgi:acyl-CoA dehydrogenase
LDELSQAVQTAAKHASDVDREARFPVEAISELRSLNLMSAIAPKDLGGAELGATDMVRIAQRLARACAATALVWSMHQGQLASLCRFTGGVSRLDELARSAVSEQWLIASATSEAASGGNLRSSEAAIEDRALEPARVRLVKQATTVSYGAEADLILVTARRSPDAAPSDQILAAFLAEQAQLTQTSQWNPMGMRGTSSPGFRIEATIPRDQILPAAFGDIAAGVMIPVTQLLWAAVWTGLAAEALDRSVSMGRRRLAGGKGGQPTATLAEARWRLAGLEALLAETAAQTQQVLSGRARPTVGLTVRINSLKVAASETAMEIAFLALRSCGITGYMESGEFSVARIIRDLSSSLVMIGNDRLLATTAQMLVMERREPR